MATELPPLEDYAPELIKLDEFIVSIRGRLFHYPCAGWAHIEPSQPTLEGFVRAATEHVCSR